MFSGDRGASETGNVDMHSSFLRLFSLAPISAGSSYFYRRWVKKAYAAFADVRQAVAWDRRA
jgi:hypothetical protein